MTIRLLDRRTARLLSPLYCVMLSTSEMTHLPELVEAFGPDAAAKFLDLFAGMTLHIPSRSVLEQAIRDVRIWMDMTTAPGRGPDLATEYDLTPVQLKRIVDAVDRRMRALGIQAQEIVS